MARVNSHEFPADAVIDGADLIPIYQAGPMNTTGAVKSAETVQARAKEAAAANTFVILDRAYSGFEFASRLGKESYDTIMKNSFATQVAPFMEAGVPLAVPISPTKCFVTFAMRPCGLLLVFTPDSAKAKEVTLALNTAVRARGSSFEHPITRAFVKALVKERESLEKEHEAALARLAESEALWRTLVKGTPMEPYFTDHYAGLFRNLKTKEGAAREIYNEHLYPVLAQNRCRLNVTGIPDDKPLAKKQVSILAKYCF